MAYGVKYTTTYYRRSGGATKIDILEDGYGGAITTLLPATDPLTISVTNDINNIYAGTIGSGATIRVLADPLSLDLFTTDPQKYKVIIYNGSTLIWQGFINAGIYSEPLGSPNYSLITLNANDGMNVLDMMNYAPDASTFYLGHSNIADIFSNIFGKLNLSFTDCRALINYSVDAFRDNIFISLSAKQENYINEKDEPMTCRQVLTEIMKSFGLLMFFRGDTIHILDPLNLHDCTNGQQFNTTNWGETVEAYPGGFLDISLNQITWYEKNIQTDINPPFYKFDIEYRPYTFTEQTYDFNDTDNIAYTGTWVGKTGYYIANASFNGVTITGDIDAEASKDGDGNQTAYYLKLNGTAGTAKIDMAKTNIYQDVGLVLKVSAEFYANTRDAENIYDSTKDSAIIWSIDVSFGVQIGSQYNRLDEDWNKTITWHTATISTAEVELFTTYSKTLFGGTKVDTIINSESRIADKWVEGYFIAPIYIGLTDSSTIDGSINVWIAGTYGNLLPITTPGTSLYNVLVRNVKVQILDQTALPIEDMGENISAINKESSYTIQNETYKLLHGTGPYGVSRGAYIDSYPGVEKVLSGIYRGLAADDSSIYKTQYMVVQNIGTIYAEPRYILRGKLNASTYMLDTQDYLIKWSNHLPGKAFYIANYTYNDEKEYMDVEMLECPSTRININVL